MGSRDGATQLARALRRLYAASGAPDLSSWCQHLGVSYAQVRGWLNAEREPAWLRTLRTIKRITGCSWDELLDGRGR